MAATNFMAPLFVLFLFTISIKKWNDCTGNGYVRVQGIPEFKFSTLLSQEEGIPLGYEMLSRWTRAEQASEMRFSHSLLFRILLLLGGDIELNPGDGRTFCGICSNSVRRTEMTMQCCECNGLSHLKCCQIANEAHELLIKSLPYMQQSWTLKKRSIKFLINAC